MRTCRITGTTGLAIVDAIIEGERDPAAWAKLRDPRIQATEETIQKSLVGNWQPEHLFVLAPLRLLYQSDQQQIAKCDRDVEKLLSRFEPRVDPDRKPLPPDRKHRSPTPLGNYLRRMKAKLGPTAATTATAHKIAVIFYTMVTKQVEYDESIWAARDAQRENRLEDKIKRQAKQLGYKLVPLEEKPAA